MDPEVLDHLIVKKALENTKVQREVKASQTAEMLVNMDIEEKRFHFHSMPRKED